MKGFLESWTGSIYVFDQNSFPFEALCNADELLSDLHTWWNPVTCRNTMQYSFPILKRCCMWCPTGSNLPLHVLQDCTCIGILCLCIADWFYRPQLFNKKCQMGKFSIGDKAILKVSVFRLVVFTGTLLSRVKLHICIWRAGNTLKWA